MKVWFDIEVGFGNYDGVKVLKDSEQTSAKSNWDMEEKIMCEYVILSWD